MQRNIWIRNIAIVILLLPCLTFVAKFSGPALLRQYVELGIGNCQKIPIICLSPETEIINPVINKRYLAEALERKFPDMQLRIPKDFVVVKEHVTKIYYKKHPRKHRGATIYLLYEPPNFFVNLFPQAKKQGIENDYQFISRVMSAKISDINNLTDMFFVITKTIFTPNLGGQKNVKIVKFTINDKKGFITYNLSRKENYFDCNIANDQGDFFKIYIKDKTAMLDLDKVLAIISTLKKGG